MRTFDDLPPPHAKEVRLRNVSREAVLAACAPVLARRRLRLGLTVAGVLLALPPAALALVLNQPIPGTTVTLDALLGLSALPKQIVAPLVLGPAVASTLVALVAWLTVPTRLVASVPDFLQALPPGGTYSLSLMWGLLRPGPAGPLSKTELAIWGQVPGEPPWLLTLDGASSSVVRTSYQASGVGVSRQRRRSSERSLTLSVTSDGHTEERELGNHEPSGAELLAAYRAWAAKAGRSA